MPRPDKGTRQKLIDTAMTLIWSSGYGVVSVDDICREASVKKGSFYHYFPSKQDLALTAMEEHFKQTIEPDLLKIFAANMPLQEQIDQLVDNILAHKKREFEEYGHICGCPLAALGSEMAGQEEQEAISATVEDMFARCRLMMEGAIQNAMETQSIPMGDASQKAREIHDFITGLKMMARIHNSLDGLERDLKPGMYRILGLKYNLEKIQNRS